jgi:chromosome segregation ATPase
MLQDLDQLAARVGQLAHRARQLAVERDALRARLDEADGSARTLRDQIGEKSRALDALSARLKDHDGEIADRLAQTQRSEAELRDALERQQLAYHELESRLVSRDADVQRLRDAASSARERIDAVLARLPGALHGEET